jgi:putative molybdopterin biosynthesis protein
MAVRERFEAGRLRLVPVGLVEDDAGRTLVYPVDKGSGATTSLVEADGVVEMAPETASLDAGEAVTVQLFGPDVRPPTLFGVGEDDPALSRLLDRLDRPRYLSPGTREGLRRLRNGVPDVAVAAGPDAPGAAGADVDAGTETGNDGAEALGAWRRDWGLVVPAGNPDDVTGLASLVDGDLRFVNRPETSGLRTAVDQTLAALATERGTDRGALADQIDGYALTGRAHESPPRRVAAGEAAAGLGLRATAAKLDLGFVSLGTQRVVVLANPERTAKSGVAALGRALDSMDDVVAALPGYETV